MACRRCREAGSKCTQFYLTVVVVGLPPKNAGNVRETFDELGQISAGRNWEVEPLGKLQAKVRNRM